MCHLDIRSGDGSSVGGSIQSYVSYPLNILALTGVGQSFCIRLWGRDLYRDNSVRWSRFSNLEIFTVDTPSTSNLTISRHPCPMWDSW